MEASTVSILKVSIKRQCTCIMYEEQYILGSYLINHLILQRFNSDHDLLFTVLCCISMFVDLVVTIVEKNGS